LEKELRGKVGQGEELEEITQLTYFRIIGSK
jgi:hypothetical protein